LTMNKFDEDLQAAIKEGTRSAADKKHDVWNKIEQQYRKDHMRMKRFLAGKMIAAAVAVAIVITGFTPLGQAAIGSIAELFEPQKNIPVEVEGMEEQTEQQLHVGTLDTVKDGVTYVLYIDEERYEFIASQDGDRIIPKDYPSNYPEVYMQIVQNAELSPEDAAAQVKAELEKTYAEVRECEQITKPVSAIRLVAIEGYEWNDSVVSTYFIDNTQGGTFIITAKYFVEAEEGHGARFEQMLADFEIVSAKQAE